MLYLVHSMKKIFLLAAAALSFGTAQAQTAALSCCARPATASATEAFAMLADNQAFVGGHDAPLPFTYTGEGQMIEFKTTDGNTGSGFEIKSATPSNKYLLVYQEWWGLNDYIKQEAARFAKEMPGVNVLAVDLYDGKIAEAPEQAGELMKNTKTSRLEAIIKGAQLYAGPRAQSGLTHQILGSSRMAVLAGAG